MRSLVVKSCPSHERSLRNFCAKSRATEKLPTITMSKKRVEMKELRIYWRGSISTSKFSCLSLRNKLSLCWYLI